MSEYKPTEVKIEEKPHGTVTFATDVIATIAGLATTEVEGVAGMNNSSSGISDMFSRKSTKGFTKGVHIELVDNMVDVDINIIVDFGSPIPEVARGIQENVKKAIETMAGLSVRSVNIHVAGISFEKEMQAARELDEQQKKMLNEKAEAEQASKAQTAAEAQEPEASQQQEEAETDEQETAEPETAEPEAEEEPFETEAEPYEEEAEEAENGDLPEDAAKDAELPEEETEAETVEVTCDPEAAAEDRDEYPAEEETDSTDEYEDVSEDDPDKL